LHLRQRPREREEEQRPDHRREDPVVDRDADTARDPALPHRFHSGTHRRSDDDREQEEQDDKPDLPHRESQNHE